MIGEVIAQGVASGEFEAADVPWRRSAPAPAMIRFFHPQMIAQAVNKPRRHDRPDDRFPLRRALEPRKENIDYVRDIAVSEIVEAQ